MRKILQVWCLKKLPTLITLPKTKSNRMKRRSFLKNTGLASATLFVPAKSYARILGANERVNVAVAGIRSRGQAHLLAALEVNNVEVTALCDVDSRTFARNQELLKNAGRDAAKTYADVRRLLENRDIDVLTCATPDHWHAPMGILAMEAGKHAYLEKPCSHNPAEGEMLVATAKKTGKVLQIGNQQRSAPTSIEAVRDIKAGIIGEAYYGKAWYSNTRGPIGKSTEVPVPEWLDWELWQGPAPRRTYTDNYVHYNWHWFWHYGTGEINNNGLHEMDICRWALGVDLPTRVTSAGGRYHFDDDWEFYDTQVASFEFADQKSLTWEGRSCSGMLHHDRGRGATIHGTEGSILLDRNAYFVYDLQRNLIKQVNERSFSATTDTQGIGGLDVYHMRNFINAIRSGEALNSPIEEAHKSTLLCHLGNMAQRFGGSLDVDPSTGKPKSKDAMQLWAREYEPGWAP